MNKIKEYYYYHPDFISKVKEKVVNGRDMLQYLNDLLPHNVQSKMEIIFSDNDETHWRNITPEGNLIFELDLTKVLTLFHIDRIKINNDETEYQFIAIINYNNTRTYVELWVLWDKKKTDISGHMIIGKDIENFIDEMSLSKYYLKTS